MKAKQWACQKILFYFQTVNTNTQRHILPPGNRSPLSSHWKDYFSWIQYGATAGHGRARHVCCHNLRHNL